MVFWFNCNQLQSNVRGWSTGTHRDIVARCNELQSRAALFEKGSKSIMTNHCNELQRSSDVMQIRLSTSQHVMTNHCNELQLNGSSLIVFASLYGPS